MRRRCLGDFEVTPLEVADQLAESLNNAHWAREGLQALGRNDLARRLDEVLAMLREVDEEVQEDLQ